MNYSTLLGFYGRWRFTSSILAMVSPFYATSFHYDVTLLAVDMVTTDLLAFFTGLHHVIRTRRHDQQWTEVVFALRAHLTDNLVKLRCLIRLG